MRILPCARQVGDFKSLFDLGLNERLLLNGVPGEADNNDVTCPHSLLYDFTKVRAESDVEFVEPRLVAIGCETSVKLAHARLVFTRVAKKLLSRRCRVSGSS